MQGSTDQASSFNLRPVDKSTSLSSFQGEGAEREPGALSTNNERVMEREMPATVMGRAFWFVSGDVNSWEAVFAQATSSATTYPWRHVLQLQSPKIVACKHDIDYLIGRYSYQRGVI